MSCSSIDFSVSEKSSVNREEFESKENFVPPGSRILAIVINMIRKLVLLIEFGKVRYFSLKSLKESFKVEKLEERESKVNRIYEKFCSIHRDGLQKGCPSGFGTCYVRAFAVAETLLKGSFHSYEHNTRATVDPVDFQEHYSDSTSSGRLEFIENKDFSQIEDGTVFVFARPLTDFFSKLVNRFFFLNTTSQISHLCNGIKLDGKVYVLEMSKGKLEGEKDATLFETLDVFQERLSSKEVSPLNMFLPVGKVNSAIVLKE